MDQLPDDCLRLILLHIPLRPLICLRSVSAQWKTVIEGICFGTQRLAIFSHQGCLPDWPRDCCSYNMTDWLKQDPGNYVLVAWDSKPKTFNQARQAIPMLFPNLTHLAVGNTRFMKLDVIIMLKTWKRLESLTLMTFFELNNEINNRRRLAYYRAAFWKHLNSLQTLRELALFGVGRDTLPPSGELPVLAHLNQFVIGLTHSESVPMVLGQLGPACKKLTLSTAHLNNFAETIEQNPVLAENITELSIHSFNVVSVDPREFFRFIGRQFRRLTYFRTALPHGVNLSELTNALAGLQHLTTLRIDVFDPINALKIPPESEAPPFDPLPSVSTLYLKIEMYPVCSCKLAPDVRLPLGALFPALTRLELRAQPVDCSNCSIKQPGEETEALVRLFRADLPNQDIIIIKR